MSQTTPPPVQPIIIVRRGGGHDDGHHGGAWKIAFADFMTAMMAFFLVMWLTSVSDEAAKKQIAQYFNPIKLNSATPETLGTNTGEEAPATPANETSKGEVAKGGDPGNKPLSGNENGGEEEAMFRDPYAVLAEIAAEGGPGVENGVAGVPDGSGLPGLNGGDAYRDPFDPTSWQLAPNIDAKAAKDTAMQPTELASAAASVPTKTVTEVVASAEAGKADGKPEAEKEKTKETEKAGEAAEATAPSAAAGIEAEINAAVKAQSPNGAPTVEVKAGKDGITISLTDSVTSGMFEIGSAKPTPEALKIVETVAKALSERKGSIVIRGHTDSRPYAGTRYDNWQLSAARAQFAYYMLVRGGLDETRVESIEGLADRKPKDPANPEAASNRRIEILLKEPTA